MKNLIQNEKMLLIQEANQIKEIKSKLKSSDKSTWNLQSDLFYLTMTNAHRCIFYTIAKAQYKECVTDAMITQYHNTIKKYSPNWFNKESIPSYKLINRDAL